MARPRITHPQPTLAAAARPATVRGPCRFLCPASWQNGGFHVHADTDLVRPADLKGRQRLTEYFLSAPFSLQKITWNPDTKAVIYRSRRSYHTHPSGPSIPSKTLAVMAPSAG